MQDAQPDQSAMPEIAVWIGIDWADQKHAYAMQIAGEERVGRGEIDHTVLLQIERMGRRRRAWPVRATQRHRRLYG